MMPALAPVDHYAQRRGQLTDTGNYFELYERWAETYDEEHGWTLEQFGTNLNQHLERAGHHIGSLVLDAGCGTGLSSDSMRQSNPNSHILGIDTHQAMLGRNSNLHGLTRGDYTNLPYPNDTFHNLVCSLSLSNNADPTIALEEFERVTIPEGAISIVESPRDPLAAKVFQAIESRYESAQIFQDYAWFTKTLSGGTAIDFDLLITTISV